ncbi:unnamed protein product [Chrysoparadoxa australica]
MHSSEESVMQLRAAEVAATRRRYELSRFDFVHYLNQLETKKKFQLVERVCSALYAFLGYFHQCHMLVAGLEPSMRDLQHSLHLARKDFARDDRLWSAKRMQLEIQLNRGFLQADSLLSQGTPQHAHRRRLTPTKLFSTGGGTGASPVVQRANKATNIFKHTGYEREQKGIISSDDEDGELDLRSIGVDDASAIGSIGGRSSGDEGQPVMEGFLWKRSNNVRKDWKRRYFFVQNGNLYYQRVDRQGSSVMVCDVKLCTVRACDKDVDPCFCFEVISAKNRNYILQAEDEESYQAWMDAIRCEIEHLLSTGPASSSRRISQGHADALGDADLARLAKLNPVCVDCDAPKPVWASINLGIMMCVDCSGTHRSLGVHVSKVRSLTLDKWPATVLQLMERIGNHKSNALWEATLAQQDNGPIPLKPKPDSKQEIRSSFIRAKYCVKSFLSPGVNMVNRNDVSRSLYQAAYIGDVEKVLWCVAHGGDLSWCNPDEGGCTAAHQAARGGQVLVLELLAQNGAVLDAVSEADEAPLDIAMSEQKQDIMNLLVSKLEKQQSWAGASR